MTTPEQPDEGLDPATGASRGHSAPRPVPPLTPASTDETEVAGTATPARPVDPDATSVALPRSGDGDGGTTSATSSTSGTSSEESSAPTRVSAFPAVGRTRPAPAVDRSDDATAATTTTPVVPPGDSTSGEATTKLPATDRPAPPAPSETSEAETTRVVPLADPEQLAGSTNGRLKAGTREPLPDEEWTAEPTKRTGAHIWGVLGVLVAAPVAWFLLTDGALRTYNGLPPDSPLNVAGLLSLAGGLVTLVIIALVTRVTSLGAWIWGGIITLAGLATLIFPVAVNDWLTGSRDGFLTLHEGFGTNLYNYLTDTSRSGLLLAFGIVLLLLAFVSHGARRSGRYEGRVRAERDARGL
ncbi:hypothetical protein C8046_08660 [Serinibacter arcticus]|uniref:Uncharacterized protein n=1 Tax=Serinibacter arcticus TaxID=1655435 RepID=A0A2U1ZUS1_9MICO|nr:hypothetical protein [Serinibacter arcticus]PWD50711.1 hypothetical protein C8046_08660 [Serinibacter arcticus]